MPADQRAPAHEVIGAPGRRSAADARNAMCVTKIISQTNSAPKSATPKNQTYAESGQSARTSTAAAEAHARHQQRVHRRALPR